jgi:predicted nucleic acid-binding protein
VRLLADAGPLVALRDNKDARRNVARRVLEAERDTPVLSPLIAAEVDYQLQALRGRDGNVTFIEDLAAGRFEVPPLETSDFRDIAELNRKYRDLGVGLADLSIVVLAARYRTTRILTFDQRHFRLLRPPQGGSFTLLPFDDDVT